MLYQDRYPAISQFTEYSNIYLSKSGVALKGFRLVPESVYSNYKNYRFHHYALTKRALSKCILLPDDYEYFFIHNHWSRGYHHWVIESLMRLLAIDLGTKNKLRLVIPEDYPGFAFQSLYSLICDDKIVRLPTGVGAILPMAIAVSDPLYQQFDPISIGNLRNDLLAANHISPPTCPPTRKIYISRDRARMRKINNESDVQTWMNINGFEVVFTEDLSFREQLILFQQAAVVVSLHGAALTNLIFMQPNAVVHEFCRLPEPGTTTRNPCFERLASISKIILTTHYYPAYGNFGNHPGRANITVDISSLNQCIYT